MRLSLTVSPHCVVTHADPVLDTGQRLLARLDALLTGSARHVLRGDARRLIIEPLAGDGVALELLPTSGPILLDVGGVPLEADTVEDAVRVATWLVEGRLRVRGVCWPDHAVSARLERLSQQGTWDALAGFGRELPES